MIYTRINCGLRQVVKILDIFNETFDGILGKLPCYNTIENWVKKLGLEAYEQSGKALENTDYAEIVDESMMIGSEKLLLTLGIPAKHQGRPLNSSDVKMLDIAIASSWNGKKVGEQLLKASQKVGHKPAYVISDNASIMKKGVRCADIKHQHDISHSLGMYLERTYKNDSQFKRYLKLMSEPKSKYNMKPIAYLLPPTQRTIARFINLSSWVKWSSKMLGVYHTLKDDEKKVFSFIPDNASFIEELSDVIKCVEKIEHRCKHEGLSVNTLRECQTIIHSHLLLGNTRTKELGESLIRFLKKETEILESKTAIHNNSSDVLESLFGKYKARKSPNKLYGITSHILFIPIYTELTDKDRAKSFDFKAALEKKRMKQINLWSKQNLSPNLVQMRIKCLKKYA